MLTKQEEEFIYNWEAYRKNGIHADFRGFLLGIPKALQFGLAIPVLLLLIYFWRPQWYAKFEIKHPGIIITILICSVLIAIFISYFNQQHKNDLNEQYYRELMAKKNQVKTN